MEDFFTEKRQHCITKYPSKPQKKGKYSSIKQSIDSFKHPIFKSTKKKSIQAKEKIFRAEKASATLVLGNKEIMRHNNPLNISNHCVPDE